jgi:hypothetical protein
VYTPIPRPGLFDHLCGGFRYLHTSSFRGILFVCVGDPTAPNHALGRDAEVRGWQAPL